MKKIVIFGATGSIGMQAIECIKESNDLQLVGFSYFSNEQKANEIKSYFKDAIIFDAKNKTINDYKQFLKSLKPDLVLNSICGWYGLEISKLCIELNINLALANKETLVIAGKFINDLLKQSKAKLIPVDSEHTTLYELINIDKQKIKKVYITASGGPFYNFCKADLKNIDFQKAIKHPNWDMGERICLDSATLVNKCYELIEAYYLFGLTNIEPIIQRQSIVHSIVMFENNSYLFNCSTPNMKIPISLALNDFNKQKLNKINEIDFKNLDLNFNTLDPNKYLPISWFYEFKKTQNHTIGPIINIANEWCFTKFKQNKIKFLDIFKLIDKCLNKFKLFNLKKWDDLYILKQNVILFLEEVLNG